MKKQFRFIRSDSVGIWRDYTPEAFLKDCQVWAENSADFSAQFRIIPL